MTKFLLMKIGILNFQNFVKKRYNFFSTPTYKRSIQILKKINTPIYKIASTNFGFNPKEI